MANQIASQNLSLAVGELFSRFTAFCHMPTVETGLRLNVDISIFLTVHASVNIDPISRRKLLNLGHAVACWLDSSISAADVDTPTHLEHIIALSY